MAIMWPRTIPVGRKIREAIVACSARPNNPELRPNRESTGYFLENRLLLLENQFENIREFSSLRDGWPQIPCAAEQGNNSTATGNQFATNRELIRHNREFIPPCRPQRGNRAKPASYKK